MEVTPKLGDGKLAWCVGQKSENHSVENSGCSPEQGAVMGLEVGNDGAAFLPMFFGFEVNHTVGHGEVGAEAPFVFLAELAWEGLLDKSSNVGGAL